MNAIVQDTISRVSKKRTHRGLSSALILACTALTVFAAFAIVNSCTPKKSSKSETKAPYGTPEYVVEVPPGYEDLKVLPKEEQEKPSQNQTQGRGESVSTTNSSESVPAAGGTAPVKEKTKVSGHPTLIFVIDDVGYNMDELQPFLKLPFPITLAVLPQVDHSVEAAKAIHEAGKELIIHQPMQALGGNDPGPKAVYLSMDADSIEKTIAENIDSLPYPPVGMNNHMGSAVTRDAAAMTPILKLVKERGMYYLDSLTAPGTVTAQLCRETGTPYMERNVFLDNKTDRESILAAIDEGKSIARKNSAAVMIGHVWSSNLAATLMEIYPELVEEGYSLSTISEYMRQQAEETAGHAGSGN